MVLRRPASHKSNPVLFSLVSGFNDLSLLSQSDLFIHNLVQHFQSILKAFNRLKLYLSRSDDHPPIIMRRMARSFFYCTGSDKKGEYGKWMSNTATKKPLEWLRSQILDMVYRNLQQEPKIAEIHFQPGWTGLIYFNSVYA